MPRVMIYDESVQILCLVELLDSTAENNCQTDKHLCRRHGISTTAVKIQSMSILRALVMGLSASKARRQDNQTKHTILYTIMLKEVMLATNMNYYKLKCV